jgi:hypothetical protein
MDETDIYRNTGRCRYPAVHGASGYSSRHVSSVRPYSEAAAPEAKGLVSDLHPHWSGLVLSSLLMAWGEFLRW